MFSEKAIFVASVGLPRAKFRHVKYRECAGKISIHSGKPVTTSTNLRFLRARLQDDMREIARAMPVRFLGF